VSGKQRTERGEYLKPDGDELVYLVDLVVDGGCGIYSENDYGGWVWVRCPVLGARLGFTHRVGQRQRGVTRCDGDNGWS
jgi:hypothetical protein